MTSEFPAAPNDSVESYIFQYEGNPDAWEVAIWDFTQNYGAFFYVTGLSSAYPKFNTAYVVLEGWAGPGAQGQLPSCSDLPPGGSLTYNMLTFDEPKPNWNSYTPYTGPNLWSGAVLGATANPPTGPNCNWGYAANTPAEVLSFAGY
jgi:hypothetical protein